MPSQSVLALGARAFRGYEVLTPPLFPAILYVDAADSASYSGTGNIWSDVSGNGRQMTLPASDFTYNPNGFFTFNASPATIAMPLDAGYTRYPYNPARWYYSLWVRVAGASSSARELLLIEEQNIIPNYGNRFQLRLAIPANSLVPTFSQYIWPDQIVPTTSLNHVMSANTWTHFFIETHLASAAFTATLRSIRVFVDNVLQYNRGPANLNGGDFDLNPGILRLGAGVSVANFRFMTVDAPNGDSTGMSDVQRNAIYTRTAPTAP